jgi:hypothetical protein
VREGAFDPTIREFAITSTGIVVGEPFEGVEAVLSGLAREAAQRAAAARRAAGTEGRRRRSAASDDTARSG